MTVEAESDEAALARLQALESKVSEAETRLATLQASQRALATEVEAARDVDQFELSGLDRWLESWPRPAKVAAYAGFACGVVTGTVLAFVVRLVLHYLGS